MCVVEISVVVTPVLLAIDEDDDDDGMISAIAMVSTTPDMVFAVAKSTVSFATIKLPTTLRTSVASDVVTTTAAELVDDDSFVAAAIVVMLLTLCIKSSAAMTTFNATDCESELS
jgi:hypothetical protein